MPKYDAREIQELYRQGINVIQKLRENEASSTNSVTAIAYSYDAQAGSYVAALNDPKYLEMKIEYCRRLALVLDELAPESLLEAGVGEATTLAQTLSTMKKRPKKILGFDLSLSRLMFARDHLKATKSPDMTLFTGTLDSVALPDNSVDVVMTVHAMEPNGGQEEVILRELLRVTRRHLVLLEPSYELGSAETRAWIEKHGYVRDLPGVLTRLGHPPQRVEKWGFDANPRNEGALVIVTKQPGKETVSPDFVSPISKRKLVRRSDCYFCPEDGHAFPVIGGIPCLLLDNAQLVSKLGDFPDK